MYVILKKFQRICQSPLSALLVLSSNEPKSDNLGSDPTDLLLLIKNLLQVAIFGINNEHEPQSCFLKLVQN